MKLTNAQRENLQISSLYWKKFNYALKAALLP